MSSEITMFANVTAGKRAERRSTEKSLALHLW
jgi:hypothetical protein